ILESRRLLLTAVGAGARLGAEFPGLSQAYRPLQAEFAPEPPHPLDVHRPAAAHEHRVDPAIAEARVAAGQPLDLPGQGRLGGAGPPGGPKGRARPAPPPACPPLRDLVALAQVARRGALLVGGHHFFLARSWSICRSSISSATIRLSRSTSASSS